MKPTIERILRNQLNQIHAEVMISAYTESPPGWTMRRNDPDYYCFSFSEKGRAWYMIDNERHITKPGTLYFLPAGENITYGTEGEEAYCRYWCHFRVELGDIQFIKSLKLPLFVNVKDEQKMRELFVKMTSYLNSASVTRELRLKAALLELIAFYLEESQFQQAVNNNQNCAMNDVLAYIEANLHTSIQVEELAKLLFLHPNYFITIFKSTMGCSPIQYVTNRRLEAAKQLLKETPLSVTDVAKRVGLQNHYLSRLFKRYTGITPLQYRRLSRQVQVQENGHDAGIGEGEQS